MRLKSKTRESTLSKLWIYGFSSPKLGVQTNSTLKYFGPKWFITISEFSREHSPSAFQLPLSIPMALPAASSTEVGLFWAGMLEWWGAVAGAGCLPFLGQFRYRFRFHFESQSSAARTLPNMWDDCHDCAGHKDYNWQKRGGPIKPTEVKQQVRNWGPAICWSFYYSFFFVSNLQVSCDRKKTSQPKEVYNNYQVLVRSLMWPSNVLRIFYL